MQRIRRTLSALAQRRLLAVVVVTLLMFISGPSGLRPLRVAGQGAQEPPIAPEALAQIQALLQEKASRTPVQQKIDSQLLYAIKMQRGETIAANVQALQTNVTYAEAQSATDAPRLIVDVTAELTPALIQRFELLGAQLIDATPGQRGARITVTIDQIEQIAALSEVIFIQPQQEAMTSRQAKSLRRRARLIARPRARRPPGDSIRRRWPRSSPMPFTRKSTGRRRISVLARVPSRHKVNIRTVRSPRAGRSTPAERASRLVCSRTVSATSRQAKHSAILAPSP